MSDSECIFIVHCGNGKACSFQGPHLMGDVRWQRDHGDVMSTNTINSYQSCVAMMAVLYCHSQSMDYLCYVREMFQPNHISAFVHP